jgi:hypothetical protein
MTRSDWSSPDHQADYLIVAPSDFASALSPLVAARKTNGLAAVLVPVTEIGDEFGDGLVTPDALHQFLVHVVEHWREPTPRYLLLVGEASYDFRNYLDSDQPPHVPSMMVRAAFGGETVSDTLLADTDGDGHPEIAVGRWPVSDLDQLRELVQRTLLYEGETDPAGTTVFVADTSEATFPALSDRLIAAGSFSSDPLRLYGASSGETIGAWNSGAWLINYVGHGSLDLWGKAELLSIASLEDLNLERQIPIVTQFTCLTGFFAHPHLTSLAEAMLLSEHGPAATVAATSLTLAVDQESFATALITHLADPATLRIGDALLLAQQATRVDRPGGREVVATFHLLGDPALVIVRPR